MPQDPQIIKIHNLNGSSPNVQETSVSLEELDFLIRQWVSLILSNIDPPAGMWEKIKHQVQRSWPMSNTFRQ